MISLKSYDIYGEVDEIIPGLWLTAMDILERDFKSVASLCVLDIEKPKPKWATNYKYVFLFDDDEQDRTHVKRKIYECVKFIEENIQNGIVVNCAMGVSRSATMVIAYLMKLNNWNYGQAYQFVKEKREVIGPNDFFKSILMYDWNDSDNFGDLDNQLQQDYDKVFWENLIKYRTE